METRRNASPDFIIFLVTILLLSVGIIMVLSASSYSALIQYDDKYFFLKRQLTWSLLGIVVMVVFMSFNYNFFKRLSKPLLLLALLLLVIVLVAGESSHGSSRWLGVGSLSFQPSEVIKLAMVIFLAKSLSEAGSRITDFFKGLGPYVFLLLAVCGLILAQPDLGTAVAIAGTSFILFIAAGARPGHLTLLAAAGIPAVAAAIVLEPYRLQRFLSFLHPEADPAGAGFQVIQSLFALGSGGLFGLGLGQGKQKLLYIPERHTDFIFAILGEELGFIGAISLIILFFILFWRGYRVALRAPDTFSSLLAVGITSMIILQALINIGVVTGSLPVTGITLPLVSYGGSSLIFTLAGIGILLNISRYASKTSRS